MTCTTTPALRGLGNQLVGNLHGCLASQTLHKVSQTLYKVKTAGGA